MAYDQLRILSVNRDSGVYQMRLNFDGNTKWTTTGSHLDISSQQCLMSLGTFKSSRLTEELANALGTLSMELRDSPEATGNIIRDCIEQARLDGYDVHCVVGRYSNANPPVFEEFVFAGTLSTREIPIDHVFSPPGSRRTETIGLEFTPAKRLELKLSEIDWQESDMSSNVRPNWLCVVDEPDLDGALNRARFLSAKMSEYINDGTPPTSLGQTSLAPNATTKDLAYGSHRASSVGDTKEDNAGTGPFPTGNWNIKLITVIDKICDACNVVWDGVIPSGLYARKAEYDNGNQTMLDTGEITFDDIYINWNYAFGFNPFDGSFFKSPITWDSEMLASDVLKGLAIQAKCRLDQNGFDSDGRPIIRFIAFGQTAGTFPDLERLPDSSEDAFITDKDGVRITRRGYDGAVIAPANSRSPVDIEVPFAPYAIAYESVPSFDASRCMPNASLEFKEQWKCGHRGALTDDDAAAAEEEIAPLNPDGWVVGAHLFRYETATAIKNFPYKHGQDRYGSVFGFDNDTETAYHATGWSGYYPVHAIYDIDRADLTEDERKARQQNFLISYALTFGRYLRGERRRLSMQFKGVVSPNWSDIATAQTFEFTPVTEVVSYIAVEIERDIFNDILSVQFEEESPDTLPMSYRIDGDQKGNGSIGGVGSTGDITTPPLTNGTLRNVKFYSAGVVIKEIGMYVEEYFDGDNERIVAQKGFPLPYDEVAPDDYGNNSEFYFHYNGAEIGNVEIVGVSPTDTPDYWASAITMAKHGTNNTDITYTLQNKVWSEDTGEFLYQRILEVAHTNKRRIYVAGRFECERVAGVFANFTWHTLLSATAPLSDIECKSNTDLTLLGTPVAPTLTGNGNSVDITWQPRFKPVSVMAQAWGSNLILNAFDWQIGARPVANQQCVSNPGNNVNSVNISLWLNDWAAGAGAAHIPHASATDLDAQPALDIFTFDFWGTLEIKGEDATTI